MSPFVPGKGPNSTKVNYSFHWKLKEDRTLILTDLAPDDYFWFRPSSGGKLGSKLDPKLKLLVSPVTVKIWALQNALNGICTTMRTTCGQTFSSIRHCLLELLPTKTPKWAQIGPEQKNPFLLAKVKNNKYPEAETWHPESIHGWSYYRLCENLWWPFDPWW